MKKQTYKTLRAIGWIIGFIALGLLIFQIIRVALG